MYVTASARQKGTYTISSSVGTGENLRILRERAHTLREAFAGDFDEVSVRAGLFTNLKPNTKEITTTSRVTAKSPTQVCGASHILNRRTAADYCPHNGVVAVTELENRRPRITNTPIRRIRVFRRRQCLYGPLAFGIPGASLRIWLSHPTFWTASTPYSVSRFQFLANYLL